VERLNAIEGMRCLKPQGAFYVFPNVSAFLQRTIEGKKIASPCDFADFLLEEAEVARRPREVLRIWESPEPFVVLGRSSQAAREVNLEACRAMGVRVLRRASGNPAAVTG